MIVFLGVVVDTVKMERRLDSVRLERMRLLLRSRQRRFRATLRQIQRLAGVLAFASAVIAPGRLYTSEIFKATRKVAGQRRSRWLPLSAGFKADLAWWLALGLDWPGKAMMPTAVPLSADVAQFYTDASRWVLVAISAVLISMASGLTPSASMTLTPVSLPL